MKKVRTGLITLLCCAGLQAGWFKGNTHTHTTATDGQQPPAEVIQWYIDHGYNFLSITDHNYFSPTEFAGFAATYNRANFVMIPGEEITDGAIDRSVVHIIGLNISQAMTPSPVGLPAAGVVAVDSDRVRLSGGTGIYAHPSFTCCPTQTEMLANPTLKFLEVYSPASTTIPNDWLWDSYLSAGRRIYGIAADDEHGLLPGQWANPGLAWVVVRAASLTVANIMSALERGDFYAASGANSVGVELSDIQATPTSYTVVINPIAGHAYQTTFIGMNGIVLAQTSATTATYTFTGSEVYVRAVVTDLSQPDTRAWTQPKFLGTL